jgi:RHS repeat-associated protein
VISESQPANGDRFKFTARELESALDDYFYRARWYDDDAGRFIGEDPSGFQGGDPNLYRYVANTPTAFTDPLGLQEQPIPPGERDRFPPATMNYKPRPRPHPQGQPGPGVPPIPPPAQPPQSRKLLPSEVAIIRPIMRYALPQIDVDSAIADAEFHSLGQYGFWDYLMYPELMAAYIAIYENKAGAITFGNDVYMASLPPPNDQNYLPLLAHEIVHVATYQGLGGSVFIPLYLAESLRARYSGNELERAAYAIERTVMHVFQAYPQVAALYQAGDDPTRYYPDYARNIRRWYLWYVSQPPPFDWYPPSPPGWAP